MLIIFPLHSSLFISASVKHRRADSAVFVRSCCRRLTLIEALRCSFRCSCCVSWWSSWPWPSLSKEAAETKVSEKHESSRVTPFSSNSVQKPFYSHTSNEPRNNIHPGVQYVTVYHNYSTWGCSGWQVWNKTVHITTVLV